MSLDGRLSIFQDGACGMDRRGFLGRCAGCAVFSGCAAGSWSTQALGKPVDGEGRPRVRLVFSHIPPGQPTWPYISYDYETRKRELTAKLVQGRTEIDFLPVTVHDADAARRLLAEDKDLGITGYLVYMVGIWTGGPADDRRSRQAHAVCRRSLRGLRRVLDRLRGRPSGRKERGRRFVQPI